MLWFDAAGFEVVYLYDQAVCNHALLARCQLCRRVCLTVVEGEAHFMQLVDHVMRYGLVFDVLNQLHHG